MYAISLISTRQCASSKETLDRLPELCQTFHKDHPKEPIQPLCYAIKGYLQFIHQEEKLSPEVGSETQSPGSKDELELSTPTILKVPGTHSANTDWGEHQ